MFFPGYSSIINGRWAQGSKLWQIDFLHTKFIVASSLDAINGKHPLTERITGPLTHYKMMLQVRSFIINLCIFLLFVLFVLQTTKCNLVPLVEESHSAIENPPNRTAGTGSTTRQYATNIDARTTSVTPVSFGGATTTHFLKDTKEKRPKPNILIILADDVGTGDLPMYWNHSSGIVKMPNLQSLSDKGVTFLDAHASPLCAPSRYMLLSGNYPHRGQQIHGTWGINKDYNQFRAHQQSIAQVLMDKANYNTAMFGKWHIGGKVPLHDQGVLNMEKILTHEDHDWSQALIEGPQDIGFKSSFITPNGIQKAPYSFLHDGFLTTNISDAVYWEKGQYSQPFGKSVIKRKGEGDATWDSTAYNMILVNETEAFVDHHMANNLGAPFFVYVALGAVHGPHSPPDKYLDGTPVDGIYPSSHMNMLLEMDKAVGSLIEIVDKRGLGNDTITIFASDNGGVKPGRDSAEYGHNSHGPLRGYKGTLYEGGHRIPLIVRWEGHIPAKETRSNIISITDIYATLCDIASVKKPLRSAQDSISFANYLYAKNDTSGLRKWYGVWRGRHESIRRGNLKLIRHHDTSTGKKVVELYDLTRDISETNNIRRNVDKDSFKKLKRKLRKIGPCPRRDRKRKFKLSVTRKRVNCNFFKDDPTQCNIHNEGEIFCPSVCSRFPSFCNN